MILKNLHIDENIKFQYDKQILSYMDQLNEIGATKKAERILPFTPTNENSIFVDKEGVSTIDKENLIDETTTLNFVNGGGGTTEVENHELDKAFDDNSSTYFLAEIISGDEYTEIFITLTDEKMVNWIEITAPDSFNTETETTPRTVEVFGSYDEITWFPCLKPDSVDDQGRQIGIITEDWDEGETKTLYFEEGEQFFKYYKVFLNNRISGNTWLEDIVVADIKLFGEPEIIGTEELPFNSVNDAVQRCKYYSIENVVIKDNGIYEEEPIIIEDPNPCKRIVAAEGFKPTIKLKDEINTIRFLDNFVDKSFLFDQLHENWQYINVSPPFELKDGTFAIIYNKIDGSSSPMAQEIRIRRYDTTMSVILSDKVLKQYPALSGWRSTATRSFEVLDDYIIYRDRYDNDTGWEHAILWVIDPFAGVITYETENINSVAQYNYTNVKKIRDNVFHIFYRTGDYRNNYFYEVNDEGNLVEKLHLQFAEFYFPDIQQYTPMYYSDENYAYICELDTGNNIYRINIHDFTYENMGPATWEGGGGPKRMFIEYKGDIFYFTRSSPVEVRKVFSPTNLETKETYTFDPDILESILSQSDTYVSPHFTLKFLTEDILFIQQFPSSSQGRYVTLDFSKFPNPGFLNEYKTVVQEANSRTFTAMWQPMPDYKYCFLSGFIQSSNSDPTTIRQYFKISNIDTYNDLFVSGIIFDGNKDRKLVNNIRSDGNLTVEYCNFENIYNNNEMLNAPSYIAEAEGEINIKNCYIFDYDKGFKFISNNLDFQYNIMAFGKETSLSNTGSENIYIGNNTFHNSMAGVELIENNGNETYINNISFSHPVYGLKTDEEIDILHSCFADFYMNNEEWVEELPESSMRVNPLFVNNGFDNPNIMDLHIQTEYEGYPARSAAYRLGNDGYDAGVYQTEPILQPPEYKSFIVPKPRYITPIIKPVNEVLNEMQNGHVESKSDSFQLEITFNWETLLEKHITDILDMIMTGGSVNIFFSPESDTTKYETYTLVYNENPFENPLYKFAEVGFHGIELTFVRKFEKEELHL